MRARGLGSTVIESEKRRNEGTEKKRNCFFSVSPFLRVKDGRKEIFVVSVLSGNPSIWLSVAPFIRQIPVNIAAVMLSVALT